MKIGIITFHWATNYGAVLQAYALYTYLKNLGNDVEVINYYPPKYKKNIFSAVVTYHIKSITKRIKDVKKEREIEKFRIKNLKRSAYYPSGERLKRSETIYDCYICGSDQIWNMSFLKYGERKRTYTYFLDFAPGEKILASYAASFGSEKYAEDLKQDIKQQLRRLDFISVREETGLKIVNELGFDKACIVPDPAILLTPEHYTNFVELNKRKNGYVYSYMLHGRDNDAEILFDYLKGKGVAVVRGAGSVEDWLTDIYYSQIVITNSFHGVVFSVIFEKPFVALLIDGSGMNDRIITLLNTLDLSDRIFNNDISIIDKPIDWKKVSQKLHEYRGAGIDFLDKVLAYKKDVT